MLWTWWNIWNISIYYAWLLGWWDKQIVDQESDVPSIIFSYTFYRLRALKTLYLYFCNLIKKNKKMNWKDICKKSWKKIILGTSDAQSKSHLSQQSSKPAYYIADCWIKSPVFSYDTMVWLVKIIQKLPKKKP